LEKNRRIKSLGITICIVQERKHVNNKIFPNLTGKQFFLDRLYFLPLFPYLGISKNRMYETQLYKNQQPWQSFIPANDFGLALLTDHQISRNEKMT